LLIFLLFAGAFYLLMRLGYGAHTIHSGHAAKFIDPVCGMEVDHDKGYRKMYQGREYRFCARICLDKFDANPERFLSGMEEDS